MRLHIHVQDIDEIATVRDAAEALKRTKEEATKRAPFLLRPVVKAMSELTFAAEVVKRHNANSGDNDAPPRSADEFLQWAEKRGYVTVMDRNLS